uniref:Uncharacterized protein n=1 Tax=Romanomermis culicivorax TaxID=13658 RepID=A0A915J7Z3_ROMCU
LLEIISNGSQIFSPDFHLIKHRVEHLFFSDQKYGDPMTAIQLDIELENPVVGDPVASHMVDDF